MFPAQALAEAMLAKGWRVKLATEAGGGGGGAGGGPRRSGRFAGARCSVAPGRYEREGNATCCDVVGASS